MEIRIENYLDEDEIKQIVKEELRNEIREKIKDIGISTIISNIGYHHVFEIMNKEIDGYEEQVKEQVKKIIEGLTSYSVFRKKDLFEHEDSLGQKYLEKSIEENKDIINNKVIQILNELSKDDISFEIGTIIEDKLNNLFCKNHKEE